MMQLTSILFTVSLSLFVAGGALAWVAALPPAAEAGTVSFVAMSGLPPSAIYDKTVHGVLRVKVWDVAAQ